MTDRYVVGDRIGARGVVEVRQAHDRQLGRDVAVLGLRVDLADDAATVDDFRRVAARLASTDEIGLAKVFDVTRDAGRVYVVAALSDAARFGVDDGAEADGRVDEERLHADLRAGLADCAGTSLPAPPVQSHRAPAAESVPNHRPASADETAILDLSGRRTRAGADDATTAMASHAPASSARSSRRRGSIFGGERRRVLVAFLTGLFVVLASAGVVASLDRGGDEPGGDGGDGAAADGTTVTIAGGQDLDPFGTAGEHPEKIPLAFDGDPSTHWDTEGYDSPTIDIKPGVGMWVEAAEDTAPSRVEVDLAIPNVSLDLFALPQPPGPDMATWGPPTHTVDDASGTVATDLPDGTRVVVVWFHRMGDSDDGRHRAAISEIRLEE